MDIISRVCQAMQTVLTIVADNIARDSGFIQRLRKLSGCKLVQTLVFGWLSKKDATLEELSQTSAALGVEITPQALDKRFTARAANFILRVLEAAVGIVIAAEKASIPIMARFNGVYIQDSSIVTLPDKLGDIFPGCGGSSPKNSSSSVKMPVRWDIKAGSITGPYLQAGRVNDKNSPLQNESLLVAQRLSNIDQPILVGAKEKVKCRLIAQKVGAEVANSRRRKIRKNADEKGKTPSKRQLQLASWTIIATNASEQLLSAKEALMLARVRWQIEMRFKLWKNHRHIDSWRTQKPFRSLCEVYANLIVILIQHWIIITSCWKYPDRSLTKASKTIQKHALNLAMALASENIERLTEALEIIKRCLAFGCRILKRKNKPNTYQLLLALNDIP